MKTSINLLKDQRGMTGLETAIILIAFVTVAAVFSYAVLSAGLFSAERGKETIYSGLQEARSNLEICGSVMATSTDSTNVAKVIFTLKNAIAGTPIDMTACDGTGNAANKCVISLTTSSDYLNNVKWTRTAVGTNDGDNLLEPGEMFEISVNMSDLGVVGTLSENLTANKIFSLQVKPALGSTITVQRTLPASISSIMDLDLGIGGNGGSGGGGTDNTSMVLVYDQIVGYSNSPFDYCDTLAFYLMNTGNTTIDLTDTTGANTCIMSLTSDAGTYTNITWENYGGPTLYLVPPGLYTVVYIYLDPLRGTHPECNLIAGESFTLTITAPGCTTITRTHTLPDPLSSSYFTISD